MITIILGTTVIDFGMAVNSYILIITVTNNVVKAKYLRPSSDIMFVPNSIQEQSLTKATLKPSFSATDFLPK